MGVPLSTQVDDSDFQASLEQYVARITAQAMEEVVQAAYEIRNEAISRTPVDTGALRAGWRPPTVKHHAKGGTVEVVNDTAYVAAVEYGTAAHTITIKNKSVLSDGSAVFGKTVSHPGTQPKPMLRPAIATVLPRLQARLKGLK